jgi:phage/plasmid primase-like uncharacterized protein
VSNNKTNSKRNTTAVTNNNSGLSKPETVLSAAGGTGAVPDTIGQQGTDSRTQKQNLKSRLQVLKSQQKDTAKSIKEIEKQLRRLSSTTTKKLTNKQEVNVVNKKKLVGRK